MFYVRQTCAAVRVCQNFGLQHRLAGAVANTCELPCV